VRKLGLNRANISCPSLVEIHQALLAEAKRLGNEEEIHFQELPIRPAHLLNALMLEFMRQPQATRAERARALVRELERLADGPPKALGSYRPENPGTGSVQPGHHRFKDKPTGRLETAPRGDDEPAVVVGVRPARIER
jgi:hypothetical protein